MKSSDQCASIKTMFDTIDIVPGQQMENGKKKCLENVTKIKCSEPLNDNRYEHEHTKIERKFSNISNPTTQQAAANNFRNLFFEISNA